MLTRTLLFTAIGFTLTGALAAGAAQSAPPRKAAAPVKPPAVLSTASGVYTAAQAAKGEQVYMTFCVSCHPAGTYAARDFRDKWNGAPVSKLFDLVIDTMPKSEPGSLESQDYVQVISYILKINGAPPGKTPLPADSAALRKIRLYLPRR
ncbi:MAG TPA: cytochrome c [Vicinamibacterales bacterium]|nr:cytochrome c [Vicinamibacterales bacterium]